MSNIIDVTNNNYVKSKSDIKSTKLTKLSYHCNYCYWELYSNV